MSPLDQFRHFKRVFAGIDTDSIKKELLINEEFWHADTSRQDKIKVQRDTQTIFIRSVDKRFSNGRQSLDVHESRETKYHSEFPSTSGIIAELTKKIGGELGRLLLVRLRPSGRVLPHVDHGEYYAIRERFHLVVASRGGSRMAAGDEISVWQEGEVWWFNNKIIHSAENRSDEYRVHVIFDLLTEI